MQPIDELVEKCIDKMDVQNLDELVATLTKMNLKKREAVMNPLHKVKYSDEPRFKELVTTCKHWKHFVDKYHSIILDD